MVQQELIIEAGRGEKQYWRDLWRYRELFLFLTWRDILVRYKQTAIGIVWAVLRPLVTTGVLTLVFGKIAGMTPEGNVPFPLFVLTGTLAWQFFANALSECGASLVNNANLISKVYFPRLIMPASAVLTSLVDLLVSGLLLLGLLFWYQYPPTLQILLLPLMILLVFIAALGAGLLLGALTVKYRDFRIVVPFILQFGLFISPVGYSASRFSENSRLLYSLNPMAGIIDGFRWCILGQPMYWPGFLVSSVVALLLLALGIWYFRNTERSFADVI